MSVFRITRAEFAKVFKKPTVYIMAVILAVVLVISLFSYNPILKTKASVSIEGDNAPAVYNMFYGESQTNDTKLKFDKDYYNYTSNQILFYSSIFDRNKSLQNAYSDFQSSFIKLNNVYIQNNNDGDLVKLLEESKKHMNNIMSCYADMRAFVGYNELNNIINSKTMSGNLYYENHYFDANDGEKNYSYTTLQNKYILELNLITNTKDFIGRINTNNYMKIFENMVSFGQNIIENILIELTNEIEEIQTKYIELVSGDLTQSNKSLMRDCIFNLNTKINEFKALIEGLVSNKVVYAIHTSSNYDTLLNAFDSFKMIYSSIDINDVAEYTSKREAAIAIKNSIYLTQFRNYLDSVEFIKITENFNKKLAEYKKYAEKNQTAILGKIEINKKEISTAPITENIINYRLNGETYKTIVDCEVKSQLSQNLSLSTISDVKNMDLKSFNSYQNNTQISALKYKLSNGIFDNSVGSNFSINESVSTEKNMYDFTYYAMKIATALITIFTIMMIANLITSETDSGTIKLLLIRPYRRGTILLGKILATFFFSLTFLTLSFVISMVAGYFMFGTANVTYLLVTFNATKSFLIKPIWLILLFFASCVLDILFYLIIALAVSVLFRSYIGAISTSLIIYVGAMVVGALLSGSVVFAYLPFTNISLFRFLGGEIVPTNSGIGAILSSPVHPLQSIWLSLGISSIFSIILIIITFISFKRRDF